MFIFGAQFADFLRQLMNGCVIAWWRLLKPRSVTNIIDPADVFRLSSESMAAAAGGPPSFNNLAYLIISLSSQEFSIRLDKQSLHKVFTDTSFGFLLFLTVLLLTF